MPDQSRWWHTIELPSGEVTPGGWDLRPTAARMPWPRATLDGLRGLDVGTMDGWFRTGRDRAARAAAGREPGRG